jgi:hypothetical protein
MKTGQIVDGLGLYSSECCSAELIFDEGDTLIRCPQCNLSCNWEIENQVFRPEDLENFDGIAA